MRFHSKDVRELSKQLRQAIVDHVEKGSSIQIAHDILFVLADAYEEDGLPIAALIARALCEVPPADFQKLMIRRYKAKYPVQGI